jgi:hypothetical protein
MLLLINDRLAHGRLRSWAAFTKTAADLCARQQVEQLSPAIANSAIARVGSHD